MTSSDGPFSAFSVEEWQRDYRDVDTTEVLSRLEETWSRDLLLQDYFQASADGRHRNQLVHYSFYIGLVVLGLILNLGWMMWDDKSYVPLTSLLLIGSLLHALLYFWSLSAKNSRDACWDRRSEIEDMVKLIDDNLLRGNDSTFKRLTRETDGRYVLKGKGHLEKMSVAGYIVMINAIIAVVLLLLAVSTFLCFIL